MGKMKRAERKHNDKLSRLARRDSLYRRSAQTSARLAAQDAAQRATTVMNNATDRSVAASDTSVLSTEMAIQRGSQRALLDNDDDYEQGGGEVHSTSIADFDLTTVTEDATPSQQTPRVVVDETPKNGNKRKKKKKKLRILRMPRKKGRRRSLSMDKSSTNREAWMCGCCGKVFSTYRSAELHEAQCIQEEVAKLGLIETAVPVSGTAVTPNALKKDVPAARVPSNVAPQQEDEWSQSGSFQSALSSVSSMGGMLRARKSVDFADLHPGESGDATEIQANTMKPILRRPMSPVPFPTLLSPTSQNGQPEKKRDSLIMVAKNSLYNSVIPENREVDQDLLLPSTIRQYVVLSDEALVNVVQRASPMTLTPQEIEAERELSLLALDKAYYDAMAEREVNRKQYLIARSEGKGVYSKVQNKFVDAYQLIKEGGEEGAMTADEYTRKKKGGGSSGGDIVHTDGTMYINVIVKQSYRVVSNELERLAKLRWETLGASKVDAMDDKTARFERFRAFAREHAVKLAGLALASDFTPRRIAVQLSNDLYRLTPPALKRRGVDSELEIEYRVGPYFILAVNIKSVQWVKIMRYAHKDNLLRRQNWTKEQEKRREGSEEGRSVHEEKPSKLKRTVQWLQTVRQLTAFDALAQVLSWLYLLPRIISVPTCWLMYYGFLRSYMRRFILLTVTNDIFSYVEQKGMELEVAAKESRNQAPFMLAALRELREDSRELKKKRQETEAAEKGEVVGPLLGPAIKTDKAPAALPADFEPPENLETVGLDLELPVGFKRLRWALLNSQSKFLKDALWEAEAKYEDITTGEWSNHNDTIGLPSLPDAVKPEDLIGAEKESSYLMPKSAFVKANMAYETKTITHYSDYCFCVKFKTLTPEVPYGSTFIAWTQTVITNLGNDTCRMVCSVEAEFPNGPPMVAGQIRSGMRAGTAQSFVLTGETICKYADEYP